MRHQRTLREWKLVGSRQEEKTSKKRRRKFTQPR
ncbi:hypothetical protein CFAL_02545 [Corynebacterium falsenii DSM 44353]|nr:hypothetical protein CFAL_02545 [Corynebacterium falsenii DSM 44353]